MTPSPILIPRQKLKDPSQPEKTVTIRRLCGLPTPTFFAVVSALLIAFFVATEMARLRGRCVDLLHTARTIVDSSCNNQPWLRRYSHFLATLWNFHRCLHPIVFFHMPFSVQLRGKLHKGQTAGTSKQLHFVDDKIALFDIPALEIDVDVDGLMG
jgi:hypothetical protein